MDLKPYFDAILPHIGAIIGFGMAFVLIARLMRERRRPSNTFTWLLLIVLAPYVGVPLYLLIGGRKITKLSKGKGPIHFSDHLKSNDAVVASPFGLMTSGNRTQFSDTGTKAFNDLVASIQQAKESIDITTFILSHDAVGRRIVKELAAKAREGLEVRLLLDALGSFGKKTFYMLELEKSGGKIERFMPVFPIPFPGAANLRNHRKIAIFDKKKAIIGGRNIGREYMGPTPAKGRWKDLGAQIEGPAVMALNSIFEADWSYASRKRGYKTKELPTIARIPDADGEIEIMASGPDTTGDPLYEKTLSAIQEAKDSITIVTPYFIPDEVLLRSLSVKARTGKKVTLIIPRKSNHRITDIARRHFLRDLISNGVHLLFYGPGMLHGKAMLIDNRIAMTGSANMDLRSLFVNYEVAAFFYSQTDIDEISKWIQILRKNCESATQADLTHNGLLNNITEDVCRLIAPLL